jgi:hypothetical protein
MSFGATISRRTVMTALLLLAAGASLLGNWVASYLRPLAQTVLLPVTEPMTDVALTIRNRMDQIAPPSRWKLQLDQARLREDSLRYKLEAERVRFAEHLRIDHEEKAMYGLLNDPNGVRWYLVWAKVAAGPSLPYGQSRVVRTTTGRSGAYVATVDLLTDRSESLPENLLVMDSRTARVPPKPDDLIMVGQIISSGAATAQMQLVTDAQFQIEAKILRDPNKRRQIATADRREWLTNANNEPIDVHVRGDGKGGMIATEVSENRNVLPGDWVVTTGRTLLMPDRIRIGRVSEVTPDPRHPWLVSVQIRPVADPASISEVFIVVPRGESRPGARD